MWDEVKQQWLQWLAERGLEHAWERLVEVFPVLFFAGGFVMDAMTLGRHVNLWTLGYVGVCALGVVGCFVFKTHDWLPDWQRWVNAALHFLLGAVFSALVVLYFRSAGTLVTGIAVAVMVAAMIYNEVAAQKEASRELIWAIFAVSLVMFFNFLLPYAIGSLSSFWFYSSIALTLGLLWSIRHVAGIPRRSLIVSSSCAAGAIVLFWAGAIPPVPLVMKRQMACVNVETTDGAYTCRAQQRGVLARWGLATPVVEYTPDDRVSVLSAVAAPDGVSASLEHRWYRWSDEQGWVKYDTIPVRMTGGREAGWRFYSFKNNIRPGFWHVATAVPNGSVLSYIEFSVRQVDGPPDRVRQSL
jgi:hypothetical protein